MFHCVSVCVLLSVPVCFYWTDRMFGIIFILKKKYYIGSQILPRRFCMVDQIIIIFFLHSEFYHLDSNWQSPLWFTDGCRYFISYIWRRFEPEMSNSDSSFHKTCCRLSLFPLFPFLSSSFFTSTLSLRPFLLRLNQTANAEGQDAPLTSCVRTVLDLLLFLKYMTFRYCSSAVGSFLLGLPLFFVIHLCSFLILRNYMEICLCESKI